MTEGSDPQRSSLVLYQTEDGRTRIQCRFEKGSIWLTQVLIAELFQKDVRTVNEHLANVHEEGELAREATIRKLRIVRVEGEREVARDIEHDCLEPTLTGMPVAFVVGRVAVAFRRAATVPLGTLL